MTADTLSRRARRLATKTGMVPAAPTLEVRKSVVAVAEGTPGLSDRPNSQCDPQPPCDHHGAACHNPPETLATPCVGGTLINRRIESIEAEREISDELCKKFLSVIGKIELGEKGNLGHRKMIRCKGWKIDSRSIGGIDKLISEKYQKLKGSL